MYILTGLITGGEFHATIRTIPAVLSRAQSHFFTGSLLLALESLRGRNIVFPNLKPKNVILDAHDSTRFWKESASPPFPIDLASSESLVGMKVDTSSLKWFASPHLRCPCWCCFVAISSLHLWRCLRFSYRQCGGLSCEATETGTMAFLAVASGGCLIFSSSTAARRIIPSSRREGDCS